MQDDDPLPPNFPLRSHGRLNVQVSARPRDLMADVQVKGAFTVKIITLFPEAFPGTLGLSLTGKALDLGLWRLEPIALRPFGEGKHRNVDDTPAGGGAGMVLRADVLDRALTQAAVGATPDRLKWPLIYLSPRGRPFDQAMARRFAACDGLTMICGRFEGIDQRVIDHHAIEEVSLGDFVLTGGEIAAQAMLDATVRLLPRVLGNQASTEEESFSDGLLEHPQYTKPAEWQGLPIPEVLQSGHHGEIAKWRKAQAEELTKLRRPDLWQAYMRKTGPLK
jgi:tRNA (guanine37-N1)-methyltransferase